MNIPSGKHLYTKTFEEENPISLLSSLLDKGFIGYLTATIKNKYMHEATFFLNQNKILAFYYVCLYTNKDRMGKDAENYCLNILKSEKGVFSLVELTNAQMDLVFAFHPNLKLEKPLTKRDLNKLLPNKYNPLLFEDEQKTEKSRLEILYKYGLLGADS